MFRQRFQPCRRGPRRDTDGCSRWSGADILSLVMQASSGQRNLSHSIKGIIHVIKSPPMRGGLRVRCRRYLRVSPGRAVCQAARDCLWDRGRIWGPAGVRPNGRRGCGPLNFRVDGLAPVDGRYAAVSVLVYALFRAPPFACCSACQSSPIGGSPVIEHSRIVQRIGVRIVNAALRLLDVIPVGIEQPPACVANFTF